MKIAVSIPDELFQQVEQLAQDLELSRSALYAKALREMLERIKDDQIVARMNAALVGDPDDFDSRFRGAARRVLATED